MVEIEDRVAVGDLKENFLECPVCVEEYDEGRRKPRILHCCLHAFCSECLADLLKRDGHGNVVCPLCRRIQKVSGDVTTMPADPVRAKLVEYLKLKRKKIISCHDCPDDENATSRCQTCMIFLCNECCHAHKRHHVTRTHSVLSLEELRDKPLQSYTRGHFCDDHAGFPVDFFCVPCGKLCCVSCTVVDHKGHDILKIQEAVDAKTATLDEVLKEGNVKSSSLAKVSENAKNQLSVLDTAKKVATEEIDDVFKNLYDVLDIRKAQLLSELEDKHKRLVSKMEEKRSSVDESLSVMNSVKDFFGEMKSKADGVEFLQLYSAMNDAVQSLKSISDPSDNKISRQSFGFVPYNLEILKSLAVTSGLIRHVEFTKTKRPEVESVAIHPACLPDDSTNSVMISRVCCPLQATHLEVLKIQSMPGDQVFLLERPAVDVNQGRSSVAIQCPRLNLDPVTLSHQCSMSPGCVLSNKPPQNPPVDTGCQLKGYRGGIADRAFAGTGIFMWQAQCQVTINQDIPYNGMIFEAALVPTPKDGAFTHGNGSSVCIASCKAHSKMCLHITHNGKTSKDIPKIPSKKGETDSFDFVFILDLDKKQLHCLDLEDNKMHTIEGIDTSKPLWPLFFLTFPARGDMTFRLVSGRDIELTDTLRKLLKKTEL